MAGMACIAIGAIFGGAGALMFRDSLPGREGTPEERAARLETELKRAETKIASLEAGGSRRQRPGTDSKDRLREIVENMREGKAVSMDDLVRVSQPLMRDLSPVFERLRVKGEKARVDSMSGELARKYKLNDTQRSALNEWFTARAEQTAREQAAVWENPNITLEEMVRATQDDRIDKGLDEYLGGVLSGEDLARFQTDRLTEKSERVQAEADRRMDRIDAVVKLDDAQRDRVFDLMARKSTDYDPQMNFEWGGGVAPERAGSLDDILRPDQKAALDAEQVKRRAEAEKDMAEVGLTLPANWDLIDEL